MKRILCFLAILTFLYPAFAQIPVGGWRDHLPYNTCKKVVKIKNLMYCATDNNMFSYDITDHTLNKISRITGMSDVGISAMEYYPAKDILLITYENGNIDLMHDNTFTNISDIFNKVMNGSKAANSIFFRSNFAYISYDFGIIVLDLVKNEIKDTYIIGEPGINYAVYALTADDQFFYAATEKGVFKASVKDPVLVNYTHWKPFLDLPHPNEKYDHLSMFNGNLIVNYAFLRYNHNGEIYIRSNDSWTHILPEINTEMREIRSQNNDMIIATEDHVYHVNSNLEISEKYSSYGFGDAHPESGLIDENKGLWIADENFGLVFKQNKDTFTHVTPNGPPTTYLRNMISRNGKIYVSAGGTDVSWGNLWHPGLYYYFSDQLWKSAKNTQGFDYTSLAIDPNNPTQLYAGSWNYGIFKFNNDTLIENFKDVYPSLLQSSIPGLPYVRIGGLAFDNTNNLWIANSGSKSPLLVKKADGSWKSFNVGNYINASTLGDILIDNSNQVWMVLPRGTGLFVYNTNNTVDNDKDDKFLKFKPLNLYLEPINNMYCLALDHDGAVWVGTDKGPVVFSNPETIFDGGDATDGIQPTISRQGSNIIDPLLGFQTINCIVVDGANRKWIGTDKGGAYLVSPDGTQQVYHFDTYNSPLFSNTILSIAIDDITGEVFFGTSKGIISFRSTATTATEEFQNVYVFPNPIRENYQGIITITGLISNAIVKITDVSGNLIYETKSLGGQAIWDGRTHNGQRVATGVYMVFCTNDDGSKTYVTKMLIIH